MAIRPYWIPASAGMTGWIIKRCPSAESFHGIFPMEGPRLGVRGLIALIREP